MLRRLRTGESDASAKWRTVDEDVDPSKENAEFQEIWNRYHDADGKPKKGWMLAPNGKATKLTARQWVQVRTPSFKKWFGDWLEKAEVEHAIDFSINGQPVSVLSGNEFEQSGNHDLIDRVEKFFNDIGGSVENDELGKVVLDRQSVKSSIGHGIGREKAAAFAAVPDVIRNGVIFNREVNWKNRGVNSFVMAAPIRIGTETYVCEAIVEQKGEGKERRFYLHEVNLQSLLRDTIKTPTGGASIVKPSRPVRSILAQKTVELKSTNVSNVVDENGEPLVVYHGSNRFGETVFDKKSMMFTTDSESRASGYGGPGYGNSRGFSRKRNVEKFEPFDFEDTDTVIRKAKSVLGYDFHKATAEDRAKSFDKLKDEMSRFNDRVNALEGYPDAITDEQQDFSDRVQSVAYAFGMDESDWQSLKDAVVDGSVQDHFLYHFLNRDLKDIHDRYVALRDEYYEKFRDGMSDEGRKFLDEFFKGYDNGDALIDAQYSLMNLINPSNDVAREDGSIVDRKLLVDEIANYYHSGIYSMFVDSGKNPLVVDAKGAYWTDIEFNGNKMSTDAIGEWAKNNGYTSVRIDNVIDPGVQNAEGSDFITISPEQVKSATDNNGDFSGNNPDIQWRTYTPDPGLRSMADALGLSTEELDVLMGGSSFIAGRTLRQTMFPTEAALVGAISDEGGAKGVLKSAWNLMSELSSPGAKGKWNALLDGLRRRLTDYMILVLRMEQWIEAKTGVKVGVSESVHDAAKFAFGRQTHMMNTVHQRFLEPLKKLIAANRLNEKSKYVAGNDVLTDILLALHGPAFNRMISERTNGNDLAGSGKSTEFWVDLLRKYGAQGSKRQILAALSAGNYAGLNFAAGSVGEKAAGAVAKVMEMNKWTRQLLVDTGRLSAAQRDLWERESPFYVPLRFDMENDQNFMETFFYGKTKDEGIYTRNYTQGESKHAFGHDGVSDSPIAFSIQQCETAIVRATDNEVRAKLAALVRRHAELGEVIDPNDPAQSWKLPTTNVLGQNGKSHTVPDVNGIESKYGNIVAFKEGGDLKFIVLGRRPNAATATTTNRADADNLPQKDAELIGRAVKKQTLVEPGNVIRAVRSATRMFGILRTSASPEFLVSNFLADNGQAARNIYADFGFGAAKRFEGFVPKAVMTARRLINGNLGTSVLDQYAQEMQEDGGLIGGLATENFRDIEKQIENDVKLFAGDRKARVIDFLTKLGERLNGPVELSTRIAAYAAVREQLKTDTSKTDKEKRAIAAKYAREVTVDFNQKGEWTPVLNALYAFSNASLVDMERSMGAFLAKKGGRMAIALFAVGFLSSLVGYWQDDPDDEREGKAQWKDTKDYRKQNQMGFRVGDKYVSMPVRGLSRVCYYAGHKAYEVMAGKTGAVDAGMDMGGFIASNVFDPIGDVTKPAQAITPSVARPAMELVQNESFSGAQIYRQPMDSRQVRSEMGRQSTPSAWHAIARGLNSLTGGNRVRRGLVDVQPEILQHYYSWLTGSAGNDVARATNLVADVARWNFDDMEARNVPFMRRFVGGLDQNSATFRELQDAFKVDMDEYKEIAPTDPDVRMELANRHGYFGDGHRAQRWREELDDLQNAQRNLMKMEMKADGQAKKDIHDLRMKVQAAFIYRTEHAPEADDADRRSFDRSRNRIVDKAIAKNKREEKAAAKERERELRRNRIVK